MGGPNCGEGRKAKKKAKQSAGYELGTLTTSAPIVLTSVIKFSSFPIFIIPETE